MSKTILITGSTDGIGLETAKMLSRNGHKVLLHGRNSNKLAKAEKTISQLSEENVETYIADLSKLDDVYTLANHIIDQHSSIDVLINNAGVYSATTTTTPDNLDIRFAVKTIAPYLLTKLLIPILGNNGRVINLSSAAQATVDRAAMAGERQLTDGNAYAQSKLALTMWSRQMGLSVRNNAPSIIAVNPGSMLGSKMVKDAFGVDGGDLRIGANILVRAALDDEFSNASGEYYDNDRGDFAPPHSDALNTEQTTSIVHIIEKILADRNSGH